MKLISITLSLTILTGNLAFGQNNLPFYDKEKITVQADWLVEPVQAKTDLYENESLVIYNPMNEPKKRKIKVHLYYTGLKDEAKLSCEEGPEKTIEINRDYNAWFDVEIPARSQTWLTIK